MKEQLTQPEGFASYKAIQLWLKETHGLEVPLSTVHGTVKYRLKAGPKVPRPYAENHDPEAVEEFKKNGSRHPRKDHNSMFRKIFYYSLLDTGRKPVRPKNHHPTADYPEGCQTLGQGSMAIECFLSVWRS